MLQRSSRRFSSGVPVRARRCSARSCLTDWVTWAAGVLDELRLVENHDPELELLQGLEVTAEQGVVGDDEVVLGDLFAQVVPGGAAFEDEHLEAGA